ncbi:sensor domain-containing diguanylate cyclase [Sphingosinithalassobacter sp. CS137]|uniref:GGDEF domain-containing protein n=1 Tax=Sphingosinithalassobacter sp. CS137 TaxID=2762748 RepID=UPI00165D66D9|nr:GGDEF domain-containing protein [Sphingosinithalassobacter sp. CS137]
MNITTAAKGKTQKPHARWPRAERRLIPRVPAAIADRLALQQSERLHAFLPLMCLLIAANALAMAYAVLGDLPWWQQAAPPVIIVGACLAVLAASRIAKRPVSAEAARRQHRRAAALAGALGLVAGFWCVNAFTETEQYYCMTAPVFIGISAIVAATCLLSVPGAAIAAMAATLAPIIVKLASYDYGSLRAMAAMLALVALMQAGVVLAKFRETIATLALEARLERMAEADALTGLDNRLAFDRKLEAQLDAGASVIVALGDLDGFKPVNDTHGHAAGDAVLIEIARRMTALAPSALSVARLGGDEFALLFADGAASQARHEIEALGAALALPIAYDGTALHVGCSLGTATSDRDGAAMGALLHAADMRLYAAKAARCGGGRTERRSAAA